MRAEVVALFSALCFASGHIVVKLATRRGNLLVGLVVSLATAVIVIGVVAAVTVDDWSVPPWPMLLFGVAGITGPGLGRFFAMRAVRDAGTSVAIPVQTSANPLLSSLAGVVLFGETMDAGRILALGLIVSGIVACARGGSANRGDELLPLDGDRPRYVRALLLLWPLAAGAAYASSDVLRKTALIAFDDAVLGTFIGMCTSFVLWSTVLTMRPAARSQLRRPERSLGWFVLHGVVSTSAVTLLLVALSLGELSVVAPIIASQPVIVIVLGALLLRSVERLRPGTVGGALAVFVAVAYLTLR